jgi:hypothetical protein
MDRKEVRDKLIAEHRKNGCVEISKLPIGTRIILKTCEEVYELEVGTPERSVVLVASNKKYRHREKVVVTGSSDPVTKVFLPGVIGEGLEATFRHQRPSAIYKTKPVIHARILGRDDSFEYALW